MQPSVSVRSAVVDYYAAGMGAALTLAARWSAQQAAELGERVDVWVPSATVPRDHPEVDRLVRTLRAQVRAPLMRSLPPRRRVTVAVAPSMQDIAELDGGLTSNHALCVLSPTEFDSRAWRLRTSAEVLDARPEYVQPPAWDLAPTVGIALAELMTIPDYNALAGPDGQRAGAALKALHRAGYPLPPADILGFALQAGWRLSAAQTLASLAERADRGVNLQIGPRSAFGPSDVRRWQLDAGEVLDAPGVRKASSRRW